MAFTDSDVTNISTGQAFTRRDFGKGLAAILAAGCAPALLGQTARGLMHRNLGGRIATGATVEKAENKIVVAIPAGATSGLGVTFVCDRPATAQVVDWGDGTTTSVSGTSASHTYAASGTYNITWPDALLNVTARGNYVASITWKVPPTYIIAFGLRRSYALASVGDLSSVTRVDQYAFQSCSTLPSVNLTTSCISIGEFAFYECTSLASVGKLSAVTTLGINAFQGCSSLASVNLTTSCISIGNWAFGNCTSLASVGDLSAVTTLGINAFMRCVITDVGDLSSCTSIGANAFRECAALTRVGDISACTSIGNWAFGNCTSLTSVGDLSSITTFGGVSVFAGCSSLTSLSFSQKTIAEVKLMANFPWGFNNKANVRINCSDGYTVYDGRNWIDHYN